MRLTLSISLVLSLFFFCCYFSKFSFVFFRLRLFIIVVCLVTVFDFLMFAQAIHTKVFCMRLSHSTFTLNITHLFYTDCIKHGLHSVRSFARFILFCFFFVLFHRRSTLSFQLSLSFSVAFAQSNCFIESSHALYSWCKLPVSGKWIHDMNACCIIEQPTISSKMRER